MFSSKQKEEIADKVEKVLLSYDHPEMPKQRPFFKLFVGGKEDWSWAEIKPNWIFETEAPSINPWNEMMGK